MSLLASEREEPVKKETQVVWEGGEDKCCGERKSPMPGRGGGMLY